MSPTYRDVLQILSDYRSANTPRDKQEVIRDVKKRFPEIAERLSKLANEGKEGAR